MARTHCLIIFGVVACGELCGKSLVAQSTADPAASPISAQETAAPAPPISSQTSEQASVRQYVPALDGSGPINMDRLYGTHMLIGATMTSGWDSNPENLAAGQSSATYNISPYIEAHGSTPRARFLMQYQPTFGRYSGYGSQTMHVVSGRFVRNLSARATLTVDGTGSHGQNSLRLNAPTQTAGAGSAADPNAASYLPNAGLITDIEGGGEFSYDLSARSSVHIRLANSYTSVPNLATSSEVATEDVSYQRRLNATWTALAYQRNARYYGSLSCTTVGGGAGLQWMPKASLSVSASAGPQIDTASCKAQQGFAYKVAVASSMPHSSQAYLYAAREPASGYLGPGLWQDGATAGYRREIRHADALATEISYLHSSSLLNTNAYQNVLLNATYTHILRSGPVFGVSYRNSTGRAEQVAFGRNILLFSLSWTPRLGRPIAH